MITNLILELLWHYNIPFSPILYYVIAQSPYNICDIDLKIGLISRYQASDCATGLLSRRNVIEPEPNVCTKQCQVKQSYHFTVAVTISAVDDLDPPRKNATAKNEGKSVGQDTKIHA